MSAALSRLAVVSYHSSPLAEPGAGDAGGMTVYVREVARALAETGVTTDIFYRATRGRDRKIVELVPGVRAIGIEAGPSRPLDKEDIFVYTSAFADRVKAFAAGQHVRYDVVHSHYWQSGLAAKALVQAWGIPLVHSHHTLGRVKNHFLAPGDFPEPAARLDGEAEVIRAADVLIASTDSEWEQLACLYGAPHDGLKTIHPGVDRKLFFPGDRLESKRRLGLGDELVLLTVGRIQPLKGLELAIRAVAELLPALDRPLRLIVVGGASGRAGDDELERLTRLVSSLGLTDHVCFAGVQPQARLPLFYRAADVLVLSSYWESFGLVALEAHACGTPVVATAVGGLSFIVRDGRSGWLVDTRDPALFAARLKVLLSDSDLRAAFGREAARSARKFSWERTADALSELYECLLTESFREACTC